MTLPRVMGDSPPDRAQFSFDGSILVEMYDLMFHDGNDVKPFSSMADAGSEDLNQRNAARRFAGIAADHRTANETSAVTTFPVITDSPVEYDCESSTFEVGDLVGPDETATADGLEDQKVKKVTDVASAIGLVTKRYGSATTRVEFRLLSRVLPNAVITPPNVLGGRGVNSETLTGAKTLTLADARIQVLDPGGAGRTITMPAEADSQGEAYIIHNAADAAEVLTIKDDAATPATICTPTQNESAILFCDGTTWRGIVGANN